MPPITQNSKVGFTIGALCAFTATVIYGTVNLMNWMGEQKTSAAEQRATSARIESKLDAAISQQWTKPDHERFAQKLERGNRSLNLIVPDVNDRS